jgi:uncharacterized membrane protein
MMDKIKYCISSINVYKYIIDNKTFYISSIIMKKIHLLTYMIICGIVSGCSSTLSPDTTPTMITEAITTSTQQRSFRATGTEPFRSAEQSGSIISLAIADSINDFSNPLVFSGIIENLSGSDIIYTDMISSILLTLQTGSCSDGMSDINYPFIAQLDYSGTTYH